jgi:hypothetical protein
MWRKSRELEKISKMLLFTPLIHTNGGKKNQRNYSFGAQFQSKSYRK